MTAGLSVLDGRTVRGRVKAIQADSARGYFGSGLQQHEHEAMLKHEQEHPRGIDDPREPGCVWSRGSREARMFVAEAALRAEAG